jgi:hypothetical protein
MTYEQACEERLTPRAVINEIRAHGLPAFTHNGDCVHAGFEDDRKAFPVANDGRISGRAVLNWLGY